MTTRPNCPECDVTLTCPQCDDQRPAASDLSTGWRLRTPFGRWETITRTHQPDKYAPVLIWTNLCGELPYRYTRWTKVDATRPEWLIPGKPELRYFESQWRDGPMYVIATDDKNNSRSLIPNSETVIVEAHDNGRGKGWQVTHFPNPDKRDPAVETLPTKAAARTRTRQLGREYAKKYKVTFHIAS